MSSAGFVPGFAHELRIVAEHVSNVVRLWFLLFIRRRISEIDGINACVQGQKMAESNGPAWTDDKHCSYLNSIEQTFVQSLFGQDYRTVDASGEDDPDCVESRPMYGNPYGCEVGSTVQILLCSWICCTTFLCLLFAEGERIRRCLLT